MEYRRPSSAHSRPGIREEDEGLEARRDRRSPPTPIFLIEKGEDRMSQHRALKGSGIIAIATLFAFACGGGGGGGGGGAANKGTITIGVELPLSGTEGSQGQPILKGVRFGVTQAGGSIKGFTLQVKDFDDAGNG